MQLNVAACQVPGRGIEQEFAFGEGPEKRYEAGDIPALEVNLARSNAARARAEVRSARAEAALGFGDLRVLLGMSPDEEFEVSGDLRDQRRFELDNLFAQIQRERTSGNSPPSYVRRKATFDSGKVSSGLMLACQRVLNEKSKPRSSESSELILRAPVSGTVIDRAALRGQLADPAQPLFKIADLTHLWLTAHAFERDAVRIRAGSRARVTFPALPGRTLHND